MLQIKNVTQNIIPQFHKCGIKEYRIWIYLLLFFNLNYNNIMLSILVFKLWKL